MPKFVVPRAYFTYRNGEPRIVIDNIPYDPRTVDGARMREFAVYAARASLIRYCVWNDRNGCWTDKDCRNEFGRTMETENYRTIIAQWADENI